MRGGGVRTGRELRTRQLVAHGAVLPPGGGRTEPEKGWGGTAKEEQTAIGTGRQVDGQTGQQMDGQTDGRAGGTRRDGRTEGHSPGLTAAVPTSVQQHPPPGAEPCDPSQGGAPSTWQHPQEDPPIPRATPPGPPFYPQDSPIGPPHPLTHTHSTPSWSLLQLFSFIIISLHNDVSLGVNNFLNLEDDFPNLVSYHHVRTFKATYKKKNKKTTQKRKKKEKKSLT